MIVLLKKRLAAADWATAAKIKKEVLRVTVCSRWFFIFDQAAFLRPQTTS